MTDYDKPPPRPDRIVDVVIAILAILLFWTWVANRAESNPLPEPVWDPYALAGEDWRP